MAPSFASPTAVRATSAPAARAAASDEAGDHASASDPSLRQRSGSLGDIQAALGHWAEPMSPVTDQEAIDDALESVVQSFLWYNDAAQTQVETLRRDLKQEDEPDWSLALAEAVLQIGLGAGAAAVGARLAAGVANSAHQEFLKMCWEGGIGEGIATGRTRLSRGGPNHVVDPFLDAQKVGIRAALQHSQTLFIRGRRNVSTLREAKQLERACSSERVTAAAKEQRTATRDAWVSYLAQSKFGTRRSASTLASGLHGTTADMSTQDSRDRINAAVPGFVPGEAPTVYGAMRGDAPGVMTVVARLPQLDGAGAPRRPPAIELALLNGLNGTIRSDYQGVPLAAMKIPRHIRFQMPTGEDISLSLDEAGTPTFLPPKHRAWFVARAGAKADGVDDYARYLVGLRIVLGELTPEQVQGQLL